MGFCCLAVGRPRQARSGKRCPKGLHLGPLGVVGHSGRQPLGLGSPGLGLLAPAFSSSSFSNGARREAYRALQVPGILAGARPPARRPVLLCRKPCHLHPRWTLTVAPPPSLSSSLTPSSPASCSLSCQAAAWPAVAVAELDKAPASPAPEHPPHPHPRRPKWREGRQLPRPRPLFVWRGGGELRLAPGASWPLPSPPGSLHTALIV